MKPTIARLFSGVAGLLLAGGAGAQVFFSGSTVVIDFDTTLSGVNEGQFDGTGFTPSPSTGQLDSDAWAIKGLSDGDLVFGEEKTTGDFARGANDGGANTGGIYAFQVGGSSDVGLGFQPGGDDLTPGTITLRIRNDTGSTLNAVRVSYDIYCYNDQPRANSVNFSYSTDNVTYTSIPALNYTSPQAADPSPSWVETDRSTSLSGLGVNDGSYFYLRWTTDDVSGDWNRDEFALDDITIAVPEPAAGFAGAAALLGFALFRRHSKNGAAK